MKNKTTQRQYDILREKIQSLLEEIADMGIRYNQAPISQTSLIIIPNPRTTPTTVTKLTPKAGEEAS